MHQVGIRSFITVTLITSAVCLYVASGGGRVAAMGSGQRGDAVNAGDVEAIRQLMDAGWSSAAGAGCWSRSDSEGQSRATWNAA
jgi:hypothetical protein